MSRTTRHGLQHLAFAVAAGTALTATMGNARAAELPTTVPTAFSGTSQAMGIHLEINIPGAVSIDQDIALADATLSKAATSTGTATAEAFHSGPGSLLAPLFDGLNKTATADSSTNDSSQPLVALPDPASLAQVAGGLVTAKFLPDTVSSFGATSTSNIAAIGVGLANANLTTALDTAIGTLNGAVTTLSTTVTGTLAQVTDPLTGALPTTGVAAADQLKQTVADLPAQITAAVTQLQTGLAGITGIGGALTLQGVVTTSSVERTSNAVTSSSGAQILGIDILGGLVHVEGTKSLVTATATGAAGSATTTMQSPQVAAVTVGSLAALQKTVDDLTAQVGAVTLPTAVSDSLNTVIAQINSLLAIANVRVADLGSSHTEAEDGSSATASVQGLGITVGSPAALAALTSGADASAAAADDVKPLISIQLSPASASAAAERVIPAVVPPATPEAPEVTKKLAYTGFEGNLLAGTAVTLVLGGAYLRRRRLAA